MKLLLLLEASGDGKANPDDPENQAKHIGEQDVDHGDPDIV